MKMNNEGKGAIMTIFKIAIGIMIFMIIGFAIKSAQPINPDVQQPTPQAVIPAQTPEPTPEPEYISIKVDDMMDLLEENALKAENTYQDMYLEVTGKLKVIDSDGKYISLHRIKDDYDIVGVRCDINNEIQKNQVMEMKKGDIITVKVKITSIGEIMGYSGDIIEFVEE